MDKNKAVIGLAVLLTLCFIAQHSYFILIEHPDNDEPAMASAQGSALLQTATAGTTQTNVYEEVDSSEQSAVASAAGTTAKVSLGSVVEKSEGDAKKGETTAATMQAALNMIAALKDKVYTQEQKIEEMERKDEVIVKIQQEMVEENKKLRGAQVPPPADIPGMNATLAHLHDKQFALEEKNRVLTEKQREMEEQSLVLALQFHKLQNAQALSAKTLALQFQKLQNAQALSTKTHQNQVDENDDNRVQSSVNDATKSKRLNGEHHANKAPVPPT